VARKKKWWSRSVAALLAGPSRELYELITKFS
jgi:hypothetical protein